MHEKFKALVTTLTRKVLLPGIIFDWSTAVPNIIYVACASEGTKQAFVGMLKTYASIHPEMFYADDYMLDTFFSKPYHSIRLTAWGPQGIMGTIYFEIDGRKDGYKRALADMHNAESVERKFGSSRGPGHIFISN